jgi:hypothetical protein
MLVVAGGFENLMRERAFGFDGTGGGGYNPGRFWLEH